MKFRHGGGELQGLPIFIGRASGLGRFSKRMRSPNDGVYELPDEVPNHAPASFSAITALIVRQRPRGACRERRKRGQSGHEEDECFNTSGPGPRMVHERGLSRAVDEFDPREATVRAALRY